MFFVFVAAAEIKAKSRQLFNPISFLLPRAVRARRFYVPAPLNPVSALLSDRQHESVLEATQTAPANSVFQEPHQKDKNSIQRTLRHPQLRISQRCSPNPKG